LCDPEAIEKPQVDVIHRTRCIGSPARPLESSFGARRELCPEVTGLVGGLVRRR
jgi:hypothetical protein